MSSGSTGLIGLHDAHPAEPKPMLNIPRNIPASASTDRKTRRAIIKAIGARQFKKLYRNTPA